MEQGEETLSNLSQLWAYGTYEMCETQPMHLKVANGLGKSKNGETYRKILAKTLEAYRPTIPVRMGQDSYSWASCLSSAHVLLL